MSGAHYVTAGGAALLLGVSRVRLNRLVEKRKPRRVRDEWTGQVVTARIFTPEEVCAMSGELWRDELEVLRGRPLCAGHSPEVKARRPRLRLRGVIEGIRAAVRHRAGQASLATVTRAEQRLQRRRGIGPARGIPAVGAPAKSWVDGGA
jgi:hypothetical protein